MLLPLSQQLLLNQKPTHPLTLTMATLDTVLDIEATMADTVMVVMAVMADTVMVVTDTDMDTDTT